MRETDSADGTGPDDPNLSNGESNEGSYEAYRPEGLPEGYTPYTGQVDQNVYDRYDSYYAASERPQQEKKCCPEIGWLLNLLKFIGGSWAMNHG